MYLGKCTCMLFIYTCTRVIMKISILMAIFFYAVFCMCMRAKKYGTAQVSKSQQLLGILTSEHCAQTLLDRGSRPFGVSPFAHTDLGSPDSFTYCSHFDHKAFKKYYFTHHNKSHPHIKFLEWLGFNGSKKYSKSTVWQVWVCEVLCTWVGVYDSMRSALLIWHW